MVQSYEDRKNVTHYMSLWCIVLSLRSTLLGISACSTGLVLTRFSDVLRTMAAHGPVTIINETMEHLALLETSEGHCTSTFSARLGFSATIVSLGKKLYSHCLSHLAVKPGTYCMHLRRTSSGWCCYTW